MAITEREVEQAAKRIHMLREAGHAISARYDRRAGRIVVELNTGIQLAVPVQQIEGLAHASSEELAKIEISPTGLGLHWPRIDADVYVPALVQGLYGSKKWIAAQLGAVGGKVRSAAKRNAARANGKKGGRPRKAASA